MAPALPLSALADRWRRFRRSKTFLPAAIAVPVIAISSAGGGYAAWDSNRVAVPDVVGQPLPSGIEILEGAGLRVDDVELPDAAIGPECQLVAQQTPRAGDRVVPDDVLMQIEVEPSTRTVPSVVGMSLGDAADELRAGCLRANTARIWCVPDDFSGGDDLLTEPALTRSTGFAYDSLLTRLRNGSLDPDDTWIVCEQMSAPGSRLGAESEVGLVLTAPLTVIPAPAGKALAGVVDAFAATADGCSLVPDIVTTFPDDPAAIASARRPSVESMLGWMVSSLTPAPGNAILCDTRVRVEVIWPRTTMPDLVGLFHAPETADSPTQTSAALKAAGLMADCSGRGTVTFQSPAAGEAVPIGTAVTCEAVLVMPNIVGMDAGSATSTLLAAGVTGVSTGTGVVVSQSPAAGTHLTGGDRVSFHAEEPRRAPIGGGGGGGYAYYENCTDARRAGAAPIYRGEPGYRPKLDRDNDGIACE